jgi:hypothetical protein
MTKVAVLCFALLFALTQAFSGDGTYYNVGLGACGWWNSNGELVAALNAPQYGWQVGMQNFF